MKLILLNLLFFKIAWVACVAGAAAGFPLAGALVVAAAAAFHLKPARNPRSEMLLLAAAAALGLGWETMLVATGVLSYDAGVMMAGVAPYWIVAMWVLFATTLNVGMRWLHRSTLVAIIAGAIGGPLSFLAGERAGAVTFADPLLSLAVISVGWAVLLPFLVRVAARFDGHALAAQ